MPAGLSRRQAGKFVIEAFLVALNMRPSQLSELTGHATVTISRYRAGLRVPTLTFILDLIEEAPNVGFTVDRIAARLGHPWRRTKDPARHRSFADYVAVVRVMEQCSRKQFAIRLGVTAEDVRDLERGVLPEEPLLKKFVRVFLRPEHSYKDVIAAFPLLRPNDDELQIRDRFLKFQHIAKSDPVRRAMENLIIEECVPMAKRIASSVAGRYRRPELAEELWGLGLVLAVRDHDPRRGYLPGYLKARIGGLARNLIWSRLQTGVGAALRNHGLMVREAEEFLLQALGRSPSEMEVAQHLELPVEAVRQVAQALSAGDTVLTDNLDLLMQEVIDISVVSTEWMDSDSALVRRFRRLSEESKELLYLHYFDELPLNEVARLTDATEADVSWGLRCALAALSEGV
ncbi:sigma-70 family RNA polymerase sigma factor [Actinoplanes sp. RD1]|uniref:sigma-70 family RNA polymerase sigma factor n=1 Tax=Actinoplanes sp. RD1 TaxID=3064538 RepID=UPI00274045B8|nr:sigma-70 domain-containing protein [Actinoplanes sp. RD1]